MIISRILFVVEIANFLLCILSAVYRSQLRMVRNCACNYYSCVYWLGMLAMLLLWLWLRLRLWLWLWLWLWLLWLWLWSEYAHAAVSTALPSMVRLFFKENLFDRSQALLVIWLLVRPPLWGCFCFWPKRPRSPVQLAS